MKLETLYYDACNVYKAVESVTGLPASSASLSDMYILKCKPNVKFSGKPVSHLFVKLSVSASSLTPAVLAILEPHLLSRQGFAGSKTELLFKRLAYAQMEASAYEVVKKIYYSHMCPFFVRVYGVGFDCTYGQILKLLDTVSHNFERNLWYMLTNVSQRPAIHEDTKEDDTLFKSLDPDHVLRFNLLLLQYVQHPSVLNLMMQGHYNNLSLLLQLTFMVGYGCYALFLNGLCHRDLHLGNVLVEPCGEERTLVLIVDDRAYRLKVTEFPRLFDFDRSKEQPCPTSAQDLFYFVSFFAPLLDAETQTKLAGCFLNITNPFKRGLPRLLTYWKTPVQERKSEDTQYLLRQLEPLPKVLSSLSQLEELPNVETISMEEASTNLHVFIARRELVDVPDVRSAFFATNR